MFLSDYVELNPRVSFPKDATVPFVSMDAITPGTRKVYPTQERPAKGYIAKTERVVPPASLRLHFQEQVAPLFTQIAMLGQQIQTLRRTRDLLLPRLLSGQIDVEALPEAVAP